MNSSAAHYLLFCESGRTRPSQWRFVVRNAEGLSILEAADDEPCTWGDRLELLTVVRGLEALDEPARVTLVSCSPYVRQGIYYGLPEWRDNGWRWERFGQMEPIKNADLWQRLDHVLQFHRVVCQQRRVDAAHAHPVPCHDVSPRRVESEASSAPRWAVWVECGLRRLPSGWARPVLACYGRLRHWWHAVGGWEQLASSRA
jgi:ribonuclease HI